MAPKQRTQQRGRSKDQNPKKIKKKISVLTQERVDYVDYKDVNLLQRFVSDRSKIRARRVSGNDTQQQREVAVAVKNAREMALLPYTRRVATQRGSKGERSDGDRRGPRGDRGDRGASVEGAPPVDELGIVEATDDLGVATDAAVDSASGADTGADGEEG